MVPKLCISLEGVEKCIKEKIYQDLLNVKTVVLTWKFRVHILRSRDKILGKYLCFPDLRFLPFPQLSIISQCKTWDFGLDGSVFWMAVLFFFFFFSPYKK